MHVVYVHVRIFQSLAHTVLDCVRKAASQNVR